MKNLIKKILKEGDFDWIKEIDPAIELEPNTIYYFEPPITKEELYQLSNRISNSSYIKDWLTRDIDGGKYNPIGMKYFVTGSDLNGKIRGWCNGTSLERVKLIYPDANVVDVRNEFGL